MSIDTDHEDAAAVHDETDADDDLTGEGERRAKAAREKERTKHFDNRLDIQVDNKRPITKLRPLESAMPIVDYIVLVERDWYLQAMEAVTHSQLFTDEFGVGIIVVGGQSDFDRAHKEYPDAVIGELSTTMPSRQSILSAVNYRRAMLFQEAVTDNDTAKEDGTGQFADGEDDGSDDASFADKEAKRSAERADEATRDAIANPVDPNNPDIIVDESLTAEKRQGEDAQRLSKKEEGSDLVEAPIGEQRNQFTTERDLISRRKGADAPEAKGLLTKPSSGRDVLAPSVHRALEMGAAKRSFTLAEQVAVISLCTAIAWYETRCNETVWIRYGAINPWAFIHYHDLPPDAVYGDKDKDTKARRKANYAKVLHGWDIAAFKVVSRLAEVGAINALLRDGGETAGVREAIAKMRMSGWFSEDLGVYTDAVLKIYANDKKIIRKGMGL